MRRDGPFFALRLFPAIQRTRVVIVEPRKKKTKPAPKVRSVSKNEVLAITGLSYPTLWLWAREGRFPRGRIVGGRSMWISTEIDAWLAGLPVRPLKGDDAEFAA
jgi:predicted DNA-binding transcriptional regulator AlpA